MSRCHLFKISELSPGALRRVEIAGKAYCVALAPDGQLYAIDDLCSHEEASLSEGELIGFQVECPQHLSRFDVRSGAVSRLPAMDPVSSYPVVVEAGEAYLEL